ncbi:lipase [Gordonia sp. VNQ95]|uniref:alpha/beta hydrolase family protein n=1 Tax=Gordonia sp. VNQ95 TaxID=3156619 RepID=UPI0032B37F7B
MITIRRRPRWVARRTRTATAAVATAIAVATAVTGSVIGLAQADPEATVDSASPVDTTTSAPTTSTGTGTAAAASAGGGAPGTVYANRQIPGSRLYAGAGSGHQFTYWSVGADDQPHLSTGSLYLPTRPAPRGGYPVVALAHGSRGIADDCAPSVHPTDADLDQLRTWLGRGYAVVGTDYAGLGTSGTPQYFDLQATARNIVDAVAAGHDISDQLSKKWAVVGEGQGASAAVVLARGVSGARSAGLDYRGSAATSIPAEFASVIGKLGPTTTVTAPPVWVADALYTLAAIGEAHPEVGLSAYLTDTGRTWVAKAKDLCVGDLTRAATGLDLGSLFSKPLAGNTDLTTLLTSASTLPTRGFTRPVLMSQTLQDSAVIVPLTLKYITDARADRLVDGRTYLTPIGSQAETMSDNDVRAFVARVTR